MVSLTMFLFDDASVRKKIKVMTKWEAMWDDERNYEQVGDAFYDAVENFLTPGRRYRITIEDTGEALPVLENS